MNVAEIFSAGLSARGAAPALVAGPPGQRQIVGYAELDRRSARIAAYLRGRGLGAGDPAVVLEAMSIELYAVLLALLRIGAVPVVFDPSAGVRHIDACCEALPPRALIAAPKAHALRLVSRGLAHVPIKASTGRAVPGAEALSAAARCPPDARIAPLGAGDTALVTFTSGTSGRPKGVPRTHGVLAAQLDALAPILARPGSIDLVALPIFALACLANGGTCLIPETGLGRPDRADGAALIDQVVRHGARRVIAAPALLERLLAAERDRPAALAGLGHIVTGGGPVFSDLIARLECAAPGAEVTALYGSTEAEPIAWLSSSEVAMVHGSRAPEDRGLGAGRIAPGVRLAILPDRFGAPMPLLAAPLAHEDLEAIALAPGEPGEIVVHGPNVVAGYLDPRHDRETKIRVGGEVWHRTGDAGYRDGEGRLWLLGRCEARPRDDDGVLYPLAVEAAARARLGPRRVALATAGGRRVLVVEGPLAGAERLLSDLAWAKICEVVVVERLPVDPRHNSKIDHGALDDMLRRRFPGRPAAGRAAARRKRGGLATQSP